MNSPRHGAASAAGFGLTFLLLGAALLLQEYGHLALNWTYVLALIITVVGAVVLFSALVGAHRSRGSSHPASPMSDTRSDSPTWGR